MRALVVDDSTALRAVLRRYLGSHKFEVSEAKNGVDALKVLSQIGTADLMLVDWNMPEMDGFQFVCEVRKDQTYQNTPIVMVTTESSLHQVSEALQAGASDYIMKPFTPDILTEKLRLLGLVQDDAEN